MDTVSILVTILSTRGFNSTNKLYRSSKNCTIVSKSYTLVSKSCTAILQKSCTNLSGTSKVCLQYKSLTFQYLLNCTSVFILTQKLQICQATTRNCKYLLVSCHQRITGKDLETMLMLLRPTPYFVLVVSTRADKITHHT